MRTVLLQCVGRAVVLGAIALVAIGVSGGVAAALGATEGAAFVAGDPPNVHYSAARCADFLEYAPGARTCEAAATEHHLTEVVDYRVAAGVVGLGVLAACAWLRRRRPGALRADRLPRAFSETVAAALFGLAAVYLLGYGLDQAVLGYHGAGTYFADGAVALLAAMVAATLFLRRVGGPTTTGRAPGWEPVQ